MKNWPMAVSTNSGNSAGASNANAAGPAISRTNSARSSAHRTCRCDYDPFALIVQRSVNRAPATEQREREWREQAHRRRLGHEVERRKAQTQVLHELPDAALRPPQEVRAQDEQPAVDVADEDVAAG